MFDYRDDDFVKPMSVRIPRPLNQHSHSSYIGTHIEGFNQHQAIFTTVLC